MNTMTMIIRLKREISFLENEEFNAKSKALKIIYRRAAERLHDKLSRLQLQQYGK